MATTEQTPLTVAQIVRQSMQIHPDWTLDEH